MNMRIDSLDVVNHHQAGVEIGNTELKRHSDQAKRLGNDGFKKHPQLNGVKGAVQSLQPDQLLKVLKNTHQALHGKGGEAQVSSQDIPMLKAPQESRSSQSASRDPKLSASATMTALLGKISQLSADSSLTNLISQLEVFNAMMSGAGEAYSSLANQLEQQGKAWASDADALKDAQQKSDALSDDVNKAQSTLDDAQKTLSALEAEAAKQNPVSAELQKKIDEAKVVVAGAQASLTQATKTFNDFNDKTLNPAIAAEKNSRTELDSTQSQSKGLVDSLSSQQNNAIEQLRKQSDAESKSLTFLMALMAQLIDKSSSDELSATAELKQQLAEASAKDAEKKAKEYEEEVRKSEEMQKTMGCIGKILGWLITAVSFVSAVFTGGASLALAAVGLALAVGDEINQAVTGKSFMADAMQPLMDAIVKPLMELLGKMFSAILEGLGVDKETAAMVGQILGAIAAAAALVVAVVVAGSVMSKVFGVIMKKIGMDVAEEAGKNLGKSVAVEVEKEVVQDVTQNVLRTVVKGVAKDVAEEAAETTTKSTMQRLMDSAAGQMLKRLSHGIGRSAGMDELKMAKISNRTQKALTGATMVNTSVQAAGGIVVGSMLVDASKIRAEMMKDIALQDLLNEMMNRAIDTFSHRMETVNQIIKNISTVAENQMNAGKYITRKMSHVAG
ncbi:TPA: type III secretion system translocon subunit SctE [Klebsiella aerogenes]|nr:type III secretion system translocon subunit SctE [Klebsiella aerogenes]